MTISIMKMLETNNGLYFKSAIEVEQSNVTLRLSEMDGHYLLSL